jgi:hypothetical protein
MSSYGKQVVVEYIYVNRWYLRNNDLLLVSFPAASIGPELAQDNAKVRVRDKFIALYIVDIVKIYTVTHHLERMPTLRGRASDGTYIHAT